jgi:hypothetical protein
LDQLHRGYRISIVATDRWTARITHVRGNVLASRATSTLAEGEDTCLARAKVTIDRYLAFLDGAANGGADT